MSEAAQLPSVDLAVRTDPGRDPDKQVNEDNHGQLETALGLLAVVCDGMGGHAGGKEASELAVRTILERVSAAPAGSDRKIVLRQAIEEANARVWSTPTAEAGLRPGSTVVTVLLSEDGAEIAHVGDSRIYFVHAGAISQVTRDHSMVQEMVDRNIIKAEDAAKHPDANKILRALGIAKDVEVDVRGEALPFVAGDVFILCSDGLSDLVNPAEILDIAGSRPPAQAAGQLVDLANARGGHDNITAMVVQMKSSSTPREAGALVKTVQLTAHGAHPSGSTLVAAPMGPPVSPTLVSPVVAGQRPGPTAPAVVDVLPQPAAIPPAPPPRSSPGQRRSPATLVIGIVLAILSLGLIAGGAWFFTRPRHRDVKVVEEGKDAAAAVQVEDEAGADPQVTAAPPLEVPSGRPDGGRHNHRDASAHSHHDATAAPSPTPLAPPTPTLEPPACARAREMRGRVNATAQAAADAQCRAAGGKP